MRKLILLLALCLPLFAYAQPCATINSVTTSNVYCNGDSTGSISVAASATASPVSLTISPNVGTLTLNSFTGLPAGIYTITATDANLCSVTSLVSITEPPALVFTSVTSVNTSCAPGCDGSISLIATGGTGAVNYSIVPLTATQAPLGTFTNLCAGSYTVLASDVLGCTTSTTVLITSPMAPILTTQYISNAPCTPDSIQLTAGGGTPPYIYNCVNTLPLGGSPTNLGNGLFSNINSIGLYSASVTDANACSASTTILPTSSNPTATNTQLSQPACSLSNGSYTTTVNWGTNPVTYELNPGALTNTTGIFNNLGAGSYTLSVTTPACGTNSYLIDSFTLVGKLNPYPITNTANSFTLTAPPNATAPINYSLGGFNIGGVNSGPRCTGTEVLFIIDANGCQFDSSFNFVAANTFPNLLMNKSVNDASCALSNDGSIIYAPGVTLQYNWSLGFPIFPGIDSFALNLSPSPASPLPSYIAKIWDPSNGHCIQDTTIINSLGTNCGNISGEAFLDTLVNCQFDPNELAYPNVVVSADNGTNSYSALSNNLGYYQFTGLPYGNYTVSVDTNLAYNQVPSCSTIQYDTLSSTTPNHTNDFAFIDSSNLVDLFVTSFGNVAKFAPAQSIWRIHKIIYGNYYNTPVTCSGKLYALMDSIHRYDTAIPAPSLISGDTLIWNIPNISGFNNPIDLYIDSIAQLPIGFIIPIKTWIVADANQPITVYQPQNDSSNANCVVVASYDPNDKIVSPLGEGMNGDILLDDSILTYRIRFQNTGNFMAFNVFIEDTLSQFVDPSSLIILDASHAYTLNINGNTLRIDFKDIFLPDSNSNEPASHGYIVYQVKQNASNQLGDQIENTAHIYFDGNAPVVTNTTLNTIAWPVGIESLNENSIYSIYPNPSRSKVFVEGKRINQHSIKMFNLIGREIQLSRSEPSPNRSVIEFGELPTGVYLLKIDQEMHKLIVH